jgi:hypothetical protein
MNLARPGRLTRPTGDLKFKFSGNLNLNPAGPGSESGDDPDSNPGPGAGGGRAGPGDGHHCRLPSSIRMIQVGTGVAYRLPVRLSPRAFNSGH